MLARTFKSAAELGLMQVDYDGLIRALHSYEAGEIPKGAFDMSIVWCGTVGCLVGWARHLSRGEAFPESNVEGMIGIPPERLTPALLDVTGLYLSHEQLECLAITQAEAFTALREYLETGEACNWWNRQRTPDRKS